MRLIILLCVPVLATAAIWPENIGEWKRASAQPVALSDRALWDEYGFKEGETARYEAGKKTLTAAAWRMQDSTGALGAFEWQRPADAKPSKLAPLSVETKAGALVARGNYVLSFEGYRPTVEELAALSLPRTADTPPPTLTNYLPENGRVPNSERYILGPAALAQFQPGVPPSVAAFHMGSEAALAAYKVPGGEAKLAVFSYPTPQIAMQQAEAFHKVSGAMAKRTGPLVAVILSPPNADAAERLLALVRYEAQVTMSEYVPTQRDNIGNLIINAFVLIGLLLAFAAVSGLAFGGLRAFLRRGGRGEEADAMITLNLR